jgi:hypothetical protein
MSLRRGQEAQDLAHDAIGELGLEHELRVR